VRIRELKKGMELASKDQRVVDESMLSLIRLMRLGPGLGGKVGVSMVLW
jgi:hypothetical protein